MASEVHAWLARVDGAENPEAAVQLLDPEELARAERFRFALDRVRFLERRAFLRRILGAWLGIAPSQVRYRTSARGRPTLDPRLGIAFSASHSEGLAAVAVSGAAQVGIDIERIRPVGEVLSLAQQTCTAAEAAELAGLSEPGRAAAFLDLWTRKESYVKALGIGLSVPLAEVDVGRWTDGPVHPRGSDAPFTFARLGGPPGYVGWVVAQGPHVRVRAHALAEKR